MESNQLSYCSRLKQNVWRGSTGTPEIFDDEVDFQEKVQTLSLLVKEAKGNIVLMTGAGLSTSTGIPDFRGPNGCWTCEDRGKPPPPCRNLAEVKPSLSHWAMNTLREREFFSYCVSQNIDALHLRTGWPRLSLSELHGNVFIEHCEVCLVDRLRSDEICQVGMKYTKTKCPTCQNYLRDIILDWDDPLPSSDLDRAIESCKKASLVICVGTSLRMTPAANLPLRALRKNGREKGGKMVIINLQKTPKDRYASLIIRRKCDEVFSELCQLLKIDPFESQERMKKERRGLDFVKEAQFPASSPLSPIGEVATKVEEEEEEEEDVVVDDDDENDGSDWEETEKKKQRKVRRKRKRNKKEREGEGERKRGKIAPSSSTQTKTKTEN